MFHVTPVTPQLANWAAVSPTEQPPAPEPVTLADLPRVVQEAFAVAGVAVDVSWQPDEPEAPLDVPWDADTLDPDDVPACPTCGSYEQWQSISGVWHCSRCDPPHRSNLLQRKAGRFKRLAESGVTPR